MVFCRSIYVKKVIELLAFIFEQPSYSNFDKGYYTRKDVHGAQCIKPTPLTLDNLGQFSTNSTKVSVVIENVLGYSFFYENRF